MTGLLSAMKAIRVEPFIMALCVLVVMLMMVQMMDWVGKVKNVMDCPYDETNELRMNRPLTVICTVLLIMTFVMVTVFYIGLEKGMERESATIGKMAAGLLNSPYEDELPQDLSGRLIVLYRFDCGNCHDIYPDLKNALEGREVYWVYSRSEQGRALLKEYPVQSVPTGMYVCQDGVYYAHSLAVHDPDADVMKLNIENLNRLLHYQDAGY